MTEAAAAPAVLAAVPVLEAQPPCGKGLLWSLLHTARTLEDRMEEALAGVGLSSPKLSVLTQLAEAPAPLSLSELASRQRCVRSNMTQLVDRLEADGLVRRIPDPADRRAVRAELTGCGRARQGEGAERMRAVEAELLGQLSAREQGLLAELLDTLR